MNAPQITLMVIMSINMLAGAYLHGKPKKGNYNFLETIFNAIITISILYWGNFFNLK